MEAKQYLLNTLRKVHLLNFSNRLGYKISNYKDSKKNIEFSGRYPSESFPPVDMVYEVFGRTSYERYYLSGQRAARNLVKLFQQYSDVEEKKILEWGCGVSRILRHLLKMVINSNCQVYGTDLNPEMIDWNKDHLKGITFKTNKLLPPIDFESNYFDIIYCTSVFTHLKEDAQQLWMNEIHRILKKDGLFLFTTHGDFYANEKLNSVELNRYLEGEFVLRAKVADGSKLMTTFQSPDYVKEKMLNGFELLEHNTDTTLQIAGSQDIWIVKKT